MPASAPHDPDAVSEETSDRDPQLRRSLRGMLSESGLVVDVRQDILSSWQRSAAAGVKPEALALPYTDDLELSGRLERAAKPVIDHLATDLAGSETSLVLADGLGRVAIRRVFSPSLERKLDRVMLVPGFSFTEEHAGTNGIGSVLGKQSPVLITGGEHFADMFIETACAGAPITDPLNGQILGVIDISTSVSGSHSLMLPLVKQAAWEIEQRLLERSPLIERLLYEHFLAARRKAKGPLVLVGEFTLLANTAASRLVDPADRDLLWDWALRAIASPQSASPELQLINGVTVVGECEPVHDARMIVGALIRLRPATLIATETSSSSLPRGGPPSGWDSLTAAERSVAELVAQGYTNREAGAKLFLSWHTVDSHLRHIYAKLGITSRVQLARITAGLSE